MDLEELSDAVRDFMARHTNNTTAITDRLNELEDRINRGASRSRASKGVDTAQAAARLKAMHEYMRTGASNELTVTGDGFMVGSELSPLLEPGLRTGSALARLIQPKTLSEGDAFEEYFQVSGAVAAWITELGTTEEADDSTFAGVKTILRQETVMPVATKKLLDLSSFDIAAFIQEDIGEAHGELAGTHFVSGNGVEQPRGFLTYDNVATGDASRAFGDIEYLPTGHATALTADSLRQLPLKLNPKYRRKGTWVMNSSTASEIFTLKDGSGRYIWADGLEAGQPARLVGYPVEIDENMPDVAANAYPIAFADWQRAYRIVDHKDGVSILRDPYTTKGKVKFYSSRYVGGGLRDSRAVKLLKIATS